jgi:hypothetical protein
VIEAETVEPAAKPKRRKAAAKPAATETAAEPAAAGEVSP